MLSIIEKTIAEQHGVLFFLPTIVWRGSYSGRNIIAKNSEEKDKDERGYFAVERWIVSKTSAENQIKKQDEGISKILLKDNQGNTHSYLFTDILQIGSSKLLGDYLHHWPLTKILDIGGKTVTPNFPNQNNQNEEEIPPIPAHVHSGVAKDGKVIGPGKKEAYFFPPLDVEPYCMAHCKAFSRFGVKHNVSKEEFQKCLEHFGQDDSIYSLMPCYDINPNEGWTILPRILHSPGPRLTFEIQLPQDDFNLAAWKLGQVIPENERQEAVECYCCRGIPMQNFVSELLDWDLCVDTSFREKYFRPIKIIEENEHGRRFQIFFDGFYGEGFEVHPGGKLIRPADKRPYGGIVWSGSGSMNGNKVSATDSNANEFLITPETELVIECTGKNTLFIYTVFPLQ